MKKFTFLIALMMTVAVLPAQAVSGDRVLSEEGRSCMASAVEAREDAFMEAADEFYTALQNSREQFKQDAISAWLENDTKDEIMEAIAEAREAKKERRQEAREIFREAVKDSIKAMNEAKSECRQIEKDNASNDDSSDDE
jgi:gas vesicle protein